MINSVNSYSKNLYATANNNLLSELKAIEAIKKTTSYQTPTDDAAESSTISNSSSTLSLEEIAGMMQQTTQKQATLVSEANSSTDSIDSIDADNDGTISSDEYDDLMSQLGIKDAPSSEDFFAQFDTNSDGEITSSEMDANRPTGPMGPPPTDTQTTTSYLDTDGDGIVSTEEYQAAVSALGIEDTDAANALFAEYDTDSDGKITSSEMDAKRPTGPPPTDEQTTTSYLDTDGDGIVSTEEYQAAVSALGIEDTDAANALFAKYDTDSDGKITADEMQAQQSKSVDSTDSTSIPDTSDEFKKLAARVLAAYETNYQYIFDTDAVTSDTVA
jgi:Ca2+-binding EF-hand superfamily protein